MGSVSPAKVAAVMAAVLSHVEAEAAPARAVAPAPFAAPVPEISPWAVAGRQGSMLDRTLLQRRLSKSW